MTELTTPDTVVLICQELRESEKQENTWKMFMELLEQYFTVSVIFEDDQHPTYRSNDIIIMSAKKKIIGE